MTLKSTQPIVTTWNMSGDLASYCDTPVGFNVGDSMEYEEKIGKKLEEDGELPYIEETSRSPTPSDVGSVDPDAVVSDGWINLWGDEELKKMVITHGVADTKPQHGYVCQVNMVGSLKNSITFDECEPMILQVGDAEVVIGLDLVLASMDVGEKALVEVSPSLGYGSQGREPDIPPNEVLIYLLELTSAEPEPDLSSYTTSELKLIGQRKRERGNWWFARNELVIALGCYKRALDYLGYEDRSLKNSPAEGGSLENTTPEEEEDLTEDRLKVYNNIAAIHLKMEDYDVALEAINYVVACQPKNVKALYRKGKILAATGQHASALEVLALANELEPDNVAVRDEATSILRIMKTESKQTSMLYKKMFGYEEKQTPVLPDIITETAEATPIEKPEISETGDTEIAHTDPGKNEAVLDTQTSKAKRKNVLHLMKKKPKRRSRLGMIAVCTVSVVAIGVVAYRYRDKLL